MGDVRREIDRRLRQFEAVMDGQDPAKIAEARKELKEQLDYIEQEMMEQ